MELNALAKPCEPVRKTLAEFRSLVGKALGRAGLSQKQAASDLGINESQMSRQLAGVEHLSVWRLHGLPREFFLEWILLLVDFYELSLAGTEQDRRDIEIGRQLRAVVERAGQR
jgi:hypothetical protein